MNKRIKELAKKSQMLFWPTDPEVVELMKDIDIEKFAELLVQECVKFCEHESNDDEHDEYDMGMWVKAESIKTAIKEHFGVE